MFFNPPNIPVPESLAEIPVATLGGISSISIRIDSVNTPGDPDTGILVIDRVDISLDLSLTFFILLERRRLALPAEICFEPKKEFSA